MLKKLLIPGGKFQFSRMGRGLVRIIFIKIIHFICNETWSIKLWEGTKSSEIASRYDRIIFGGGHDRFIEKHHMIILSSRSSARECS